MEGSAEPRRAGGNAPRAERAAASGESRASVVRSADHRCDASPKAEAATMRLSFDEMALPMYRKRRLPAPRC